MINAEETEFRRIWAAYHGDLVRYGCAETASRGAHSCNTPLALDLYLDGLISERKHANMGVAFSGPVDPDSNGSYGNVIMAIEG